MAILEHWKHKIKDLQGKFLSISHQHIFRQFNSEADILSKKAIGCFEGLMIFKEILDKQVVTRGTFQTY